MVIRIYIASPTPVRGMVLDARANKLHRAPIASVELAQCPTKPQLAAHCTELLEAKDQVFPAALVL